MKVSLSPDIIICGMDRLGVCQVPEGSGEQGKMEETGCEIICGAPKTPAVKGEVKVKVKREEKEREKAPVFRAN